MSTLDHFDHVRLYGLEDEYMESTLNIYGNPEHIPPESGPQKEPVPVKKVFHNSMLGVGSRLSMVYDLGTPSFLYCIVKESLNEEEVEEILEEDEEHITTSENAAVVRKKG